MKDKIQITQRALLARMKRVLAKDGKYLAKNRSEKMQREFGEYCLLSNNIIEDGGTLLELADKAGLRVLAPYEEVEK